MNLKLLVLLWAVFLFFSSTSAHAHWSGLPFAKINGKDAVAYPIPSASTANYPLPQDMGAENYLVKQPIIFALDTSVLPAPAEVIQKTEFSWDFGDGTKAVGTSVSHTYTTIGSFIIIVYGNDGTTPTPQVFDTLLVHILPNQSYKLPQPVIKLQGIQKDTLHNSDHALADFSKPLRLDATDSKTGTAPITSYLWDFGDGTSESKATTTHQYPSDLSVVFPVLRVTDQNRFFADTYLWLDNSLLKPSDSTATSSTAPSTKNLAFNPVFLLPLVLAIVAFAGYFLSRKVIKRKP